MFDYFYGQSGEMFSYFRVPKILFRDIKFKDLSTDAKTLYPLCAEVSCGKYRPGAEHEAVSAGCTLQCTHDHAALLPEPNQS